MLRFGSTALSLLLCISSSLASTTLVDSTGALTRIPVPQSSFEKGVVAVLNSPGTHSLFPTGDGGIVLSSRDGVSILSSPGATLAGLSALSKGSGAAAAAAVSGSIILSGITESDLENGLDDTRHGQTLTAIFKQRLQDGDGEDKIALIIAVPASADEEAVLNDVNAIFETASIELGRDVELQDLYNVSIEKVASETDAERVRISEHDFFQCVPFSATCICRFLIEHEKISDTCTLYCNVLLQYFHSIGSTNGFSSRKRSKDVHLLQYFIYNC